MPIQEDIVSIIDEIRICGANTQKKGSDHELDKSDIISYRNMDYARSNILVTIVSLVVLGFGLSFFAGNQRTSDSGSGCRYNSSLYQHYQ